MRKIEITCETCFVGGTLTAVIEVEDDATDKDIDEAVMNVIGNWVSWGWNDAPANAEVTD